MIKGDIDRGRPVVRAHVLIAKLGTQAEVDFLIDTGSHSTLINPHDQKLLSVPARYFSGRTPLMSRGLGGLHASFTEQCDLFFAEDDGGYLRLSEVIRFARPSKSNTDLPSLLGLDVLRYFRTVFDPSSGLLTLEAHDAS